MEYNYAFLDLLVTARCKKYLSYKNIETIIPKSCDGLKMKTYLSIQQQFQQDAQLELDELIKRSNYAYENFNSKLVVKWFKPIFRTRLEEFISKDVFITSHVLNCMFDELTDLVTQEFQNSQTNNFDIEYLTLVRKILINNKPIINKNVRTKYADGTPAGYKQYIGYQFRLDNNTSKAHILTSRFTPVKAPISELYWIWKTRSNDVNYLNDELKCKFWNEWKQEDGTIGKAYGYQLNQPCLGYPSQVDYILDQLKNNPNSRRIMTEIWVPQDLNEMALTPCVHLTNWTVENDILHLQVTQRSCDVALGLVANVFQYSILHRIIAKECGLIPGDLIWNIHNAHLYDRHINRIMAQLILWIYTYDDSIEEESNSVKYHDQDTTPHSSLIKLNQTCVNINCDGFDDFVPNSIEVKGQNPDIRKIKYEIAI